MEHTVSSKINLSRNESDKSLIDQIDKQRKAIQNLLSSLTN